ncbi:MAG: LysM domain-containing protein [Sphingorhabdus sp.]
MAIYQTYKVRSGDTLGKIAKNHAMSVDALAALNSIKNRNALSVGQELRIKAVSETYYTVASGDSLGKIAKRYEISVQQIMAANGIANANKISVGQKLIIPTEAPTQTASSISPARALGNLSKKYEVSSGGPGTVSTGRGDRGGVSYGSYQLASKMDRPRQFLKGDGKRWLDEFGGAEQGSAAFSRVWKAIAKREEQAFHDAQHAYIKRTHYDKQVVKIKSLSGVDIDSRSRALQDVVWSTAVQHGPNSSMIGKVLKELENKPGAAGYDRDAIVAIYGERGRRKADGNLAHFSRNSQGVQEGVAKRFRNELNDALGMLSAEGAVETITPPEKATEKEADKLLKSAQKSLTDDEVRLLIEKYGDLEALNNFTNGQKVLIALRNRTNSKKHKNGRYDDAMILVWREAGGAIRLRRYKGNTEPAGIYAWGQAKAHKGSTTDLDGDGRNDLGRLQAGTYHYVRQSGTFLGNKFFRARDIQVAERDVNHDGNFSIVDGDMVDPRGAGRSMLIHQGGNSTTWSAGCQTIPKSQYGGFLRTLGGQAKLSYILINAD